MKRILWVIASIILGVFLYWFGLSALGAFSTVTSDQYGCSIPGRPSILTPQVARQEVVLFVVLFVATLIALVASVVMADRASPRRTT